MKNMQILKCTLCKSNKKEDNIKCKCKVERVRKCIFELEKELDLTRMKNMKENLEHERKMYLGRYIRNRINDSFRFFHTLSVDDIRFFYRLSADEDEALNIYDKNNGEDVFDSY